MSPPPAEAVVDTLRGGEVLGGITSIDGGGFGWQREARRRIFWGESGKVREIVESVGQRGRKETRNWVLEQQRKKSGGSSSEAGRRG